MDRGPGDGVGGATEGLEWETGNQESERQNGNRQELEGRYSGETGKGRRAASASSLGGGQASGGKYTACRLLLQGRGEGLLVRWALSLGQSPSRRQPHPLACRRPAMQGSPLSEF